MSDNAWYFGRDGQQHGPVSIDELRARLSRGELSAGDLVWRQGMGDWLPAGNVPELAGAMNRPQQPPADAAPPYGYGAPTPPSSMPRADVHQPEYVPFQPSAAALQSKANNALVLGILALVLGPCVCAPIGIGLSVAAIVMGRNARGAPNPGAATAGFICGVIGLVLNGLSLIGGAFYAINHRQGMHF